MLEYYPKVITVLAGQIDRNKIDIDNELLTKIK
jgi:hypothetical protein